MNPRLSLALAAMSMMGSNHGQPALEIKPRRDEPLPPDLLIPPTIGYSPSLAVSGHRLDRYLRETNYEPVRYTDFTHVEGPGKKTRRQRKEKR